MNTLSLKEEIDLSEVLAEYLGPPEHRAGCKGQWWACPFCADQNPSLHVMPDGEHFKCFACGARGDVLDFVRRKEKVTLREAARKLNLPFPSRQKGKPHLLTCSRCSRFSGGGTLSKCEPPPPRQWQAENGTYVQVCHKQLWESCGETALDWLHNRGLTDETIRAAGLGYDPDEDSVVIPWTHKGALRKVNCRRLSAEPRYKMLTGSVGGVLYPDAPIIPGKPVLLCEGELDALLVNQECGDFLQAVTLGSASARPTAEVLASLSSSFLLLGQDADTAGDKSAGYWQGIVRRSIRVRPPTGKDWTDTHNARRYSLSSWLGRRVPQTTGGSKR